MLDPADEAFMTVTGVIAKGSKKDGSNESWRNEDVMFHLSKAASHLATAIKQKYDPRTIDGEDHLALALTRLAMAKTYPQQNPDA